MNIVKNLINRIIAPCPQILAMFLSRDTAKCAISSAIMNVTKIIVKAEKKEVREKL
jgi:hypothetical protein